MSRKKLSEEVENFVRAVDRYQEARLEHVENIASDLRRQRNDAQREVIKLAAELRKVEADCDFFYRARAKVALREEKILEERDAARAEAELLKEVKDVRWRDQYYNARDDCATAWAEVRNLRAQVSRARRILDPKTVSSDD